MAFVLTILEGEEVVLVASHSLVDELRAALGEGVVVESLEEASALADIYGEQAGVGN